MTDGSLIKNNSPVITPYVPRRQLANFQGLEDFIKGCVLGIIKNLGILLAGYNKTGNICFGFNTVIDTLERIRVHPNVVYISFAGYRCRAVEDRALKTKVITDLQ